MDFLDPLKRRRRHRRLVISYILLGLAIIGGTLVLVLATSGYSINPRTGDIVQNGLLFIESKPSGAKYVLEPGQRHGTTGARLVLPAAKYQLRLQRDGYHNWQRSFSLKEQAVLRLTYALLVPLKPTIKDQQIYSASPSLLSLSPDRRHLLIAGSPTSAGKLTIFDYDTNHPSTKPKQITLPSSLFTQPKAAGNLSAVEWSGDNNHLLLQRNYGSSSEFIMLDRNQPARSINLNKTLRLSPTSVSLRDKRSDQFYILAGSHRSLQVALTSPVSVAKPILKNLQDYKTLGSGLIIYSQPAGTAINVMVWQNGKSYRLAKLPHAQRARLAVVNFQGHDYYAVATDGGQWVNLYRDPLANLTKPSPGKLDAHVSLKLNGLTRLSASADSRLIEADNQRDVALLDLETDSEYHYRLSRPATPQWADNQHFTTISQGQLTLMDYDGINKYGLGPASAGGFLSADQHQLWFLAPAKKGIVLRSLSLLIANR